MKKLSILFAVVMLLALFTACSGDRKEIKSPDDFDNAIIAVQDETTADISIELMKAGGKNIDIRRYPQVINCFDDLKAGRVDAVYVDSVVAAFYTTGSKEYQRVWISSENEPLGILLRKDSEQLRDAVCAAVDMLYYSGKMAEIGKKHFGDDFAPARNVTTEPVIPDISGVTLKKNGTFSVGCDIGYPPMEYYDTDGTTPVGFDIDVGKEIANLLGLQYEVIDTAWDGIFAGVDRGDYDCVISSVSITAAREETWIFTKPYIENSLCIVVKK